LLKVLIVEDDLMIADMTEDILVKQGYEVCGVGRTVAEAVALARRHKPDLAVIDFRLSGGGLGTDIVSQLDGLGNLGVLYATGNASQLVQTAVNGHACLSKPYRSVDLLRGLEVVNSIVTTGTARPPFPRGFQVLDLPTPKAQDSLYA
jgi:DNA-binding response OmpR family regulator